MFRTGEPLAHSPGATPDSRLVTGASGFPDGGQTIGGRDMTQMGTIERPGFLTRVFFRIGARMFGQVPTPQRLLAHQLPLMLGMGAAASVPTRCGPSLADAGGHPG
jgi:hypothetical protein